MSDSGSEIPGTARLGAWLISLGNAIEKGDAPIKQDLDSISLTARAARFYSAIRSLATVEGARLPAYQRESDLSYYELRGVLQSLVDADAIEVTYGSDRQPSRITVKQVGVPTVYEFAARFFEEQFPSPCARVAIGILDATMDLPIRWDVLVQNVTIGFGVDEKQVNLALTHLRVLGALQITLTTEKGEAVVYNPLQFSNTNEDAMVALASLDGRRKEEALLIVSHVKAHPGVPLPADLRGVGYDVLKRCGIIDVSSYSPKAGESVYEFPTLQTAWGRVQYADAKTTSDDLIHDAKALLASIRYGEHFAARWGGKIKSPFALLRRLLLSGSVGPATNIGSDYPLIARRGIINIVEDPSRPSRYSMELVKADVVQPVLDMFRSEGETNADPMADVLAQDNYTFAAPELERGKELKAEIAALRDQIIFEQLVRRPRRESR